MIVSSSEPSGRDVVGRALRGDPQARVPGGGDQLGGLGDGRRPGDRLRALVDEQVEGAPGLVVGVAVGGRDDAVGKAGAKLLDGRERRGHR